jgi:exo-1,4-beta-D-glucosaminidase
MPNGGFYGAKSACEPLHIQYCYDDKSVKIVNCFYNDFKALTATVKIYDFNMNLVSSDSIDTDVASDESEKIFTIDAPKDISKVYFLKLQLNDGSGKQLSSNFYWLCADGDEKADFTDLNKLPKTDVEVSVSSLQKDGNSCSLTVTLENRSNILAFAVNPKILKLSTRQPVLPVLWEDNYISLLPQEKRIIKVEFDLKNLEGDTPLLKVDGWNVNTVEQDIK